MRRTSLAAPPRVASITATERNSARATRARVSIGSNTTQVITPLSRRRHAARRYRAEDRKIYLFLVPFGAVLLIFGLYPFVYTAVLSFFQFSGLGPWHFVGAANYSNLARNTEFLTSLWNTAYLVVVVAVPLTVGGLLLAVALNNKRLRGRHILRTIYILPFVTSAAIISIVFSSLFDSTYGWIDAGLQPRSVFHLSRGWYPQIGPKSLSLS